MRGNDAPTQSKIHGNYPYLRLVAGVEESNQGFSDGSEQQKDFYFLIRALAQSSESVYKGNLILQHARIW